MDVLLRITELRGLVVGRDVWDVAKRRLKLLKCSTATAAVTGRDSAPLPPIGPIGPIDPLAPAEPPIGPIAPLPLSPTAESPIGPVKACVPRVPRRRGLPLVSRVQTLREKVRSLRQRLGRHVKMVKHRDSKIAQLREEVSKLKQGATLKKRARQILFA